VFGLIAAGVGIFITTNIDDLVVVTILFQSPRLTIRAIVIGQYVGLVVLIAVSAAAAWSLVAVPDGWIPLLGIVPIALGLRALLRPQREDAVPVSTMLGVVGLTIANGADNLALYAALFRHARFGTITYVVVFVVMLAAWLLLARYIATRRPVVAALQRWGSRIVPLVFIAIGVIILAGVFSN
jgi:cadmium resistance protein CadD (predicted permease)